MAEALESLSGTAREYAEAFASVDILIERAASDVFGQLAAYGNPKRFQQIRDIISNRENPGGYISLSETRYFPTAAACLGRRCPTETRAPGGRNEH